MPDTRNDQTNSDDNNAGSGSGVDGARIHVHRQGATVHVLLRHDDVETVLPALWLRARSLDPSQRDALTGHHPMNQHLLPGDHEAG